MPANSPPAPSDGADTYTMTKNGLDVGLAAGASKFWKDSDLN